MVESLNLEQGNGQQNNYEQLQLERAHNVRSNSNEYMSIINADVVNLESCIADHFNGQESRSDNNTILHDLTESTQQQYETLVTPTPDCYEQLKFSEGGGK